MLSSRTASKLTRNVTRSKKDKWRVPWVFLRLVVAGLAFAYAASACAAPDRAADWRLIESNWPRLFKHMQDFSRAQANKTNLHLYYLELWTYDLMRAAIAEHKIPIRNALFELYESALKELVTASRYKYFYDPRSGHQRVSEHPLPKSTRLWVNEDQEEVELYSSQFLFLLASTTYDLVRSGQLDEEAQEFVNHAVPVVQEHLLRWIKGDKIFQVAGWGCGFGLYDHREFIEMKRRRAFASRERLSYCNMVTDVDLFVIGTTAELIAAHAALDGSLRLGDRDYEDLRDYLRGAARLLSDRTTPKSFRREDGSMAEGLVFDPGAADDHEDSYFSLYSVEACPSAAERGSKGVGWDVSHGARQPVVFSSLFETRALTGVDWPDGAVLAGFGRAFAYGVFEGNLNRPRLRNYLDGSNGWYRANERTCTGYRPFGLSYALIYGAWGRYVPFAPEVGPIVAAAHHILTSDDPADVAFRFDVWDRARYVDGRLKNDNIAKAKVSVWTLPILSTHAVGRSEQ